MIIQDALYGKFEIPQFLERLLFTPEFRRLSEIRLININSPSLPSLADVRRYSHTLGVLRLALLNPLLRLSEPELKAFLASILVHDAGTPAFAHLFEYSLLERYNWDHESAALSVITGTHHPDEFAHQIFKRLAPKFKTICIEAKIDFDLVLDFVSQKHPYSKLIFGTLDFDNLDNVARMNWMIGRRFDLSVITSLASNIDVDSHGVLQLAKDNEQDVCGWLDLRRWAYDVLVFDGPTVAGQAVLSKAISEAMESGDLGDIDWHYNDDALVSVLNELPSTKIRMIRDFAGELPQLCLLYVEKRPGSRISSLGRKALEKYVDEFLYAKLGSQSKPYAYVFRDRGAFSKRVEFVDPKSKEKWSVGERSDSLIIYGFAKTSRKADVGPEVRGREFRDWIEAKL